MIYSQKTFVSKNGERYCLLINKETGLPLYYPNLFLTTQVRNKSLSYSSMESGLGGIKVFLRFMGEKSENIEKRFQERKFLQSFELDAIRDYCQINFKLESKKTKSCNLSIFPTKQNSNLNVSAETEYVRLSVIAQYVKWLAEKLLGSINDKVIIDQILSMEKGLKARRPVKKNRNTINSKNGLSNEQLELLFEIISIDSELNPFKDRALQIRNRLIILLLYHLGIRGGELLNIRVRDIDFERNQIIIASRPDEKDDSRKFQPLVKTLDRRLPVKDTLMSDLFQYISNERKAVPNARRNDFLFVTHKSGSYQGQPLSKSAYKKLMDSLKHVSPVLNNLSGHQLRHSWNDKFSDYMDLMDEERNEEQQEKIRSYLMGWKEGSGTAKSYNKRFVEKKAVEAALKLQSGLMKKPEINSNE